MTHVTKQAARTFNMKEMSRSVGLAGGGKEACGIGLHRYRVRARETALTPQVSGMTVGLLASGSVSPSQREDAGRVPFPSVTQHIHWQDEGSGLLARSVGVLFCLPSVGTLGCLPSASSMGFSFRFRLKASSRFLPGCIG